MIVLGWVVLIAWLATLVRTFINLVAIPRLRPGTLVSGPRVSVIIPARNEEANIERTVRAFLSQTYAPLEIVVVDDRSTDGTAAVLAVLARDDRRLRVISGSETPPGWLGKPWALQQGSEAADGEVLLFVDADIIYRPDAVAAAVARLQDSGAAMLTLLPAVVMKSFWERVAMPQLAMTVYCFLPTWLSNRTTIGLLAIGGGSGNMIWRRDYDAAGTHEALRDAVIDDVGLARLVRRSGLPTSVVRAEGLISVRMYAGLTEIIEGFTKNTFAVFERSYVVAIGVAMLVVVFHVLPYGMALAGQWLGIVTIVMITLTRLILFAVLGYRLDDALWAHPLMMLVWAWIFLRSMWITGVRKRLAWRGRSYDAARTRFGP